MDICTINMCVQDFVYTYIFISHRCIPRSEITRSCDNFASEERSDCFQKHLHSKQHCLRVLISLCPWQHLLLSFWFLGIFVDVSGLIVVFIFISLKVNNFGHLFMLLAICISLKKYAISFVHILDTNLFLFI